ncbi:MAG: sialidase family protein [Caldilineaceae bacterium]
MRLIERGLLSRSQPNTDRANLTFPTVTALAGGTLLATWRAGSTKDAEDESIEFARSMDSGRNWSAPWRPFTSPTIDGKQGTIKLCYLTELEPDHLLAASMWIDRTSYPGQPLFNPETEGCLPMSIILTDSYDQGATWSPWRVVPMPAAVGPASLTSPLLKLADGGLAMSIETNKHYHDRARWLQKVLFFYSQDQGQSWGAPVVAGEDPTGHIFNWDLRCGVAPDGRIATFAWTYDTQTTRYLNIHRRISTDHGHSWSDPVDLGFADQAAHPAMLANGQVVLAYVDRFQSHAIHARCAPAVDAPFDPHSDVTLYTHGAAAKQDDNTGELLAEMGLWSFGLPYAEVLPTGEVLVVYYAGTAAAMDLHWARLQP